MKRLMNGAKANDDLIYKDFKTYIFSILSDAYYRCPSFLTSTISLSI